MEKIEKTRREILQWMKDNPNDYSNSICEKMLSGNLKLIAAAKIVLDKLTEWYESPD